MQVNLEKSRELAEEIAVRKNDCFRNALRSVEARPGAVLVVGVAVDRRQRDKMFEHAWIEFEGEILDATWVAHWANTPVNEIVYQSVWKMPGPDAVAKYKSTSPDECGIRWADIISPAEFDSAERAIRSVL